MESIPKPTVELVDMPFHIERKKTGMNEVSGVPLTIYQSWRTTNVSVKMREAIYSLLEMNPEFEYYLYSDEKCSQFIQANFSSDVLDAFNVLKPGAYKSDLWRYCILYVNGGMYIDIKYYSLKPILELIRANPTIYVQGTPSICYRTNLFLREVYNGFMVSPPKNIVYKDCIDDIARSCKLKLYKSTPLDVTGPCLLLAMLKKYKSDAEIRSLPFTFFPTLLTGPYADNIYYNGTTIFTSYADYRIEQRSNKKNYYAKLWAKGNIYN